MYISDSIVVTSSFEFTPSPISRLAQSMKYRFMRALYSYLSANSAYTVYDNVPQETNTPYISLGLSTDTIMDTDGKVGLNMLIPIHVWSEYHGKKEMLEMQRDLYRLLHRAELKISGFNCISIMQESETSNLDPDGITRHGIQQFRVLIISA